MRAVIDSAAVSQAPRVWDEGRGNSAGWVVRTTLVPFESDDRATWRTADCAWSADRRRSRNGQHVYLALFEGGTYLGRATRMAGYRHLGSHIWHLRVAATRLRLKLAG